MNNQETIFSEVFTPKERDENEKRKRELIELLESGEAMLLVGAGSSARLSYVTWDGLLTDLESLAIQCGDFEKNEEKRIAKPLEYAEDIKSHIRENREDDLGIYHDRLSEIFEPKSQPSDEFHRLLVNLPVRGIMTTNYDTVLEEALLAKKLEAQINPEQSANVDEQPLVIGQDAHRYIHQFLLARYNDPHLPQRIAHLHGIYRFPDKITLSEADYIETYGQYVKEGTMTENDKIKDEKTIEEVWTLHRKILWAVLATRRVIFVGFSMDDPYFNKMLEIVGKDFWVWNKPIHFAIMSISPDNSEASQARLKAERIMRDYGIETLFYPDTDGKHQGLADLIYEIAKKLGVPDPSDTILPNLPRAPGSV